MKLTDAKPGQIIEREGMFTIQRLLVSESADSKKHYVTVLGYEPVNEACVEHTKTAAAYWVGKTFEYSELETRENNPWLKTEAFKVIDDI